MKMNAGAALILIKNYLASVGHFVAVHNRKRDWRQTAEPSDAFTRIVPALPK
jgi:hypothetical protein